MAYQKKYYYTFKQLHTDAVNLVEIWQDTTDVLVAEEVTGLASPFITELSELDHKFQPVIGQGCEIGLLSETDRKFYNGLYHVDPQEFMVKHYIDGSLNYIGYLNSEMYTESYADSVNYGISMTGNDGLAIADRFTFLQEDDSHYDGIKSEFELLRICLDKIALPWDELRICLATTFTGYSGGATVTPLHETYVDCANYYDEDDYPMTAREVLESILQPYGAQLFCDGGNVYIVDVHSRTAGIEDGFTTKPTFKQYDFATGTYLGSTTLTINKTIQSIGYSGTGQSIELSGGVNKQVVAYSPYPTDVILDNALVGLDEFSGIPATWTAREDYFFKILTGNDYITLNVATSIANFEASYYDGTVDGRSVQDSNDGYLNFRHDENDYEICELTTPKYVTISSKETIIVDGEFQGAGVNITFDFLATFYDSLVYRRIAQASSSAFRGIKLYFKLSIGSLYYDGDTDTWVADSSKTWALEWKDFQREKWVNSSITLNVGDVSSDILLSGDLNFKIMSKIEVLDKVGGSFVWRSAEEVWDRDIMIWLKNLNIDIKNADNTSIPDDDVEYVGILDERFKESGQRIELTTGTDTYSSDRAKMLYSDGSDYKSITEWTRDGQTFKIEELLLNSLVSNYRRGFVKLNNMRLKQDFSILNVFTDNNISDKVFMLKNAKFDYEMNDVDCGFWETSPDNLTIVK